MDSDTSSSQDLRPQAKEILESPDLTSMETLLSHIHGDDSPKSKKLFDYCKKHYPNALSLKLSHLLQSCPRIHTRTQSATLLQNILTLYQFNAWPLISPMIQTELKLSFLASLQQEDSKPIFKTVCRIVSDISSEIYGNGREWPELLNFVFESVESDSEKIQESALLVFAHLPRQLGGSLIPHLDRLRSALLLAFSSPNSDVQVLAFRASVRLIQQMLFDPLYCDIFNELLMEMIKAVFGLLSNGQQAFARKGLEELVALAMAEREIFVPHFNYVVESMIQIAETDSIEVETIYAAIEVLDALVEGGEETLGSLIRNLHETIILRLFSILMKMLLSIEDNPAWHHVDSEEFENDAGVTGTYDLALNFLDRLSIVLCGDIIVPIGLKLVPAYLAAPEWQKRHAGIATIAVITEGCSKIMIYNLEQVVTMVSNSFQDPHPRVRWAAIDAIRLLTMELGLELQLQYHHKVLPALAAATEDFHNPRIQAHAALVMQFFSKDCAPDILTPYLDEIVSKLLLLLQNGKQMLQEGALITLASVASSSQDHFQKYYDAIIPWLKAILFNETDMSKRMLRAKSVECISSVAMAVGKEKFGNEARQVMEALISLQGSLRETDYPVKIYILQAWVRLCKCLGPDFVTYIRDLMPTLLRSAQLETDVNVMASVSGGVILESVNQSVKTFTDGVKRTGMQTNVLKEKALACNLLSCCAGQLKEGFFPWINPVADTLVPLLKFHHNETRMAVASAMPELLHSAKLAVEKGQAEGRTESYVQKLIIFIVPSLVEALNKEPEKEICARMLNSLNGCIEISGLLFSKAQVRLIVDGIKRVLTASSYRKVEIAKRVKAEDFDLEEGEEENEHGEEILNRAGDCLGTLIRMFKANFLPYFDELLSYITGMWGNDKTAKEKQIAFHIFHDVVQQCREAALKYYDMYLPFLMKACKDENPDVRQEAARGIGVCAEFGGTKFKPSVEVAVSSLNTVIGRPNSLNSDNARAYDIAVSALGKICEFHRENINAAQVVPTWLSYLPIRNDMIEAKIVHEQLCSMIERSDKELLGPENLNLPKIFAVIAQVLNERDNLATTQTADRMTALLRKFKQL